MAVRSGIFETSWGGKTSCGPPILMMQTSQHRLAVDSLARHPLHLLDRRAPADGFAAPALRLPEPTQGPSSFEVKVQR